MPVIREKKEQLRSVSHAFVDGFGDGVLVQQTRYRKSADVYEDGNELGSKASRALEALIVVQGGEFKEGAAPPSNLEREKLAAYEQQKLKYARKKAKADRFRARDARDAARKKAKQDNLKLHKQNLWGKPPPKAFEK